MEMLADNTTSIRVMQALKQSLNETERAISIEDVFVAKLRSLLVLTGTLIFFMFVMATLVSMLATFIGHIIKMKVDAYRRFYPRRYVPVKGPERHYHWARRRL